MKRECSKCKQVKLITEFCKDNRNKRRIGYGYICKPCKRAYSKIWYTQPSAIIKREARREKKLVQGKRYRQSVKGKIVSLRKSANMRLKYPEKHKARSKLRYAVKVGKIKKLPCRDCNEIKVHGHHIDYSRPFDVIWLCDKHHKQEHLVSR